jgi:hypothetical protein
MTLTVPGPNIPDGEWRRLWRAFLARARRLDCATFVWRIEKQERGQPHIHCVCWAESLVKAFRLKELWLENLALLGPYEGPANIKFAGSTTCGQGHGEFSPGLAKVTSREFWPGAHEHSVKIDGLAEKDDMCWWRYLAAHASKSKQAQKLNAEVGGLWVNGTQPSFAVPSNATPTQVVMAAAQAWRINSKTNDTLRILEIRTVPLPSVFQSHWMAALIECSSGRKILLFCPEGNDHWWTRFYDATENTPNQAMHQRPDVGK